MPNKVSQAQFNMMPDSRTMATYGDWLIVYDNINTPLADTMSDEVMKFIDCFPLRIDFTIAILCLEGRMELGANLRRYTVEAGDVLVVGPGTIGESVNISPDTKAIVISIAEKGYKAVIHLEKEIYSMVSFRNPVKFHLQQDSINPLIQEYQHLKHAILNTKNINDFLVQSYIAVLASYAMIGMGESLDPEGSDSAVYSKFMDLLAENCIEHRDLAFYAEGCGLSQKYFAKQIFLASGKHPKDWIKGQVILHAQALLRSGLPVAKVCKDLNFSSMPVFNRYFKEATGVAPKDYKSNK